MEAGLGRAMTLEEVLQFSYRWCQDLDQAQIRHELGLNPNTGVDWDCFCREVCEMELFENSVKIGGESKVVQIGESKFGKRINKAVSKAIYKELRNRVISTPSAQKKYNSCFVNDTFDWSEIYSLPHRVTSDTKLREFQFKLLNRYLVTNDFLNKIGVLPSPACSFCGKESESLEHIFISCHYAKDFWAEVIKWLYNLKVDVKNISNREILLGMPGCEDEFFVNHVILITKHYLYSCRCKNTYPLVNVFTARLKKIQDLELLIAKSKNNLSNYTAKWGKFLRNTDLLFTYLKYSALDSFHTYQGEHIWVCRVL